LLRPRGDAALDDDGDVRLTELPPVDQRARLGMAKAVLRRRGECAGGGAAGAAFDYLVDADRRGPDARGCSLSRCRSNDARTANRRQMYFWQRR
jgi:hypothetical protein